ncbi:MAG: Chorismate synthase [Pseudomonadota bacterium]|jgi:chorismate synthase
MSSTLGRALVLSTFGESHGPAVGGVLDGCPPGLVLDLDAVQAQADRRRPGALRLGTPRDEADRIEWLSGLLDGVTLGTPIGFLVRNQDARPHAYESFSDVFRPSHADFTYQAKYGIRARSGGGRASARETVSRVIAGAVAEQILAHLGGVEICAWVDGVAAVRAAVDEAVVQRAEVDRSEVRCPDPVASAAMVAEIEAARRDGDSVGGVVRVVARGVPAGLGEPVFHKLEADLAAALMSLPAARGVEIGSGFAGSALRGTAHNDAFVPDAQRGVVTATNRSGGVQGGISNGMPITLAVAFKPVATVFVPQQTVTGDGVPTTLVAKGRHDPCVVPRAVPMVEAMVALVLADHWLRWRGQVGAPPALPGTQGPRG